MRPLLSLVGIFRNEEKSIARVIESARPAIDHLTLLDTGSTDKTWDIITSGPMFAMREGEPCCVAVQEPFIPFYPLLEANIDRRPVIDFAATRNRVLELEEQRPDAAEFTLMLSGDEELEGAEALRAFLETKREDGAATYAIEMTDGDATWYAPRIRRSDCGWLYRYPIHEELVGPNGERGGDIIPGVRIRYTNGDQQRLFERFRTVDVPVLEWMIEQPVTDDHETHIARARAIRMLARTHEMLALAYQKDDPASPWLRHQMAAMALYMTRANLEGDPVDKGYALFRYYDIAWRCDLYTPEEMVPRLEVLCGLDPRRPEVRYLLAMHASRIDARKAAPLALEAARVAREAKENPLPYVTSNKIEWMALLLAAECAKVMKQGDLARKTAERAVEAGASREMAESVLA